MKIEMVDLKGQYAKIQDEIDKAILESIRSANFINGPAVSEFTKNLSDYLGGAYVIPCANGTDALQIAMMALDLVPGDEVIVPSFTYVATAEVIGLLGLIPVMVDVDPYHFNITRENIEKAVTSKTKAIVPVHLFGQCADMEPIMEFAKSKGLYVIEDTAQAIGAKYTFSTGEIKHAGTIGDIGCTSFFPSKNLGCYGDGGALYTQNQELAKKIKMISNHGQEKKYIHKYIGVNSRLDTIQAAVLNIKLKHLEEYSNSRNSAAEQYDRLLMGVKDLQIPVRLNKSTHVFHQYTLIIKENKRDALKQYLEERDIPAMIYYPIPLNEQEAYSALGIIADNLTETQKLCKSVLSLPMHTELTLDQQIYITDAIKSFLNN
ncbi:DegT/DnrJ/EryC1/StrS family aminotransferase [Aquirufa antheringensis]|uniref:DegT/DnrJ/EryC1/StrS family aminotransferase n=1 Tax=Aquirufa antheringensis TaxID=2516559 RepID=UPI0022A91955|nr:DegT/DnrJ/EryC1/StrS family aminotransferase [Aquirufa antheringensis]MCZ2490055.1 DegT/DnrJ/EryC1/StrS family aminotransferase [Aquirufa antheringensis]